MGQALQIFCGTAHSRLVNPFCRGLLNLQSRIQQANRMLAVYKGKPQALSEHDIDKLASCAVSEG